MEPGREAWGLVSPSIMRPILTTFKPSQTMAQIGPEFMYSTKPAKNGYNIIILWRIEHQYLGGEVGVVLFEVFLARHAELHGDELESSLFKSLKQDHN
jgi:hypothetical protein